MSDDFTTPALPASLAGADPFAAATPSRHPQTQARPSAQSTEKVAGEKFPCPCACNCNNLTAMDSTEVASASAAKFLRCASCAQAQHFGTRWNPQPTPLVSSVAPQDEVKMGTRTNTPIAIRHRGVDEEQEAWQREAAQQLEQERRDAARDRWMQRMPERWRLPYEKVDEVEERLARLKKRESVGTSLICFGPFGSGKTWVAHTYARAAVDQWLLWPSEILIGTEGDIVEPIANAGFRIADEMAKLLKPNLKMLIIDDVGQMSTYRTAEDRWAAFGKVVDWMYAHRRTLVITTNLELGKGGELEKWMGAAAYERLKSMAGARQVFRDEDKRSEMTARWEADYAAMRNEEDPAPSVRSDT